MPKWIHDRAQHIRQKNPGMPESQAWAIATQQSHAAGKTPVGYGTSEGRKTAKKKYDKPKKSYTQTADPSSKNKTSTIDLSLLKGFSDEMKKEAGTELLPPPRSDRRGNLDGDDEMKTKLAGHLPLQEAIARTIEEAREKMKLAAEDCDDGKAKKLLKFEKKEHGHIPSVKEEEAEYEKKSSAIDPANPEDIEKLASALEYIAGEFEKDADSIDNGGEKPQGGQQLPTQSPTGGTQPYKKNGSKKHSVPMSTGMQTGETSGDSKTQVPNDHARAPGGTGAKMPANILRKMGGVAALKGEVEKQAALKEEAVKTIKSVGNAAGEALKAGRQQAGIYYRGAKTWAQRNPAKATAMAAAPVGFAAGRLSKKKEGADPVAYILGKIAESQKSASVENGAESKQGGEQLSNTAPVPSNPGRQLIASNAAPKAATKREAKAPRKAELAQVLTEPAMSAKTDSKVNENLRNAAKGGVKIAAARAFLQKIAEEGCTCDSAGNCRHCTMMAKASTVRETVGSEATA